MGYGYGDGVSEPAFEVALGTVTHGWTVGQFHVALPVWYIVMYCDVYWAVRSCIDGYCLSGM